MVSAGHADVWADAGADAGSAGEMAGQARDFKAEPSSFAVTSTIGITRS